MPGNASADKVFLDVAFGIANGVAKLPAGLPRSDATAGTEQPPTFIRGFGLSTQRFQ
jgi:hypothetical protein